MLVIIFDVVWVTCIMLGITHQYWYRPPDPKKELDRYNRKKLANGWRVSKEDI